MEKREGYKHSEEFMYNIEDIISRATKTAIKEFNKEKLEKERNKVFHNTKLLLKHYNSLKDHVINAIDDSGKLKEDYLIDIEGIGKDELYIMSIKRSKSKTLIMVAHIDMALEILKKKQLKNGTIEKYIALEMFYIRDIPYESIVKHFNCGTNTPRRWMNEMIKELSILLFGIEGELE